MAGGWAEQDGFRGPNLRTRECAAPARWLLVRCGPGPAALPALEPPPAPVQDIVPGLAPRLVGDQIGQIHGPDFGRPLRASLTAPDPEGAPTRTALFGSWAHPGPHSSPIAGRPCEMCATRRGSPTIPYADAEGMGDRQGGGRPAVAVRGIIAPRSWIGTLSRAVANLLVCTNGPLAISGQSVVRHVTPSGTTPTYPRRIPARAAPWCARHGVARRRRFRLARSPPIAATPR
jgi:hypothetical protein